MNVYTIGSLIKQERKKRKISQKKLVAGLCSAQTLSMLEDDMCETDAFLMDMLLQRLGKSPDKLECIVSGEEYHRIKMRSLIEQLIVRRKRKYADYLLERYHDSFKSTDTAQQMYYHRTRAYLLMRTVPEDTSQQQRNSDIQEALREIRLAVDMTLPGVEGTPLSEYLISTCEMENLLAYGKLLNMTGSREKAQSIILQSFDYIKAHFADAEELCKLLPKCVWLFDNVFSEQADNLRVIVLCEEAVQVLREASVTYFMLPVIEVLVRRYGSIGAEKKAEYWRRYQDILTGLYEEYAPDMCRDSLFFDAFQREYYLDYEIIRSERISQNITQEKLIYGVYSSPETLSRVETGKSSPGKKNFDGLMDKLKINKTRYNGYVTLESFEVLELNCELNTAIGKNDFDLAKRKLEMLKSKLNMSLPDNKRHVEQIENIIYSVNNIKSPKCIIQETFDRLELTYKFNENKSYRVPFYDELIMLNIIAISLKKMDEKEKALYIWKNILDKYYNSRVDIRFHRRTYSILFNNYIKTFADFDFGSERIEARSKAVMLCNNDIKNKISWGNAKMLESVLTTTACAMIDMDIKKYSGEIDIRLTQAQAVAELFLCGKNAEIIKSIHDRTNKRMHQ